MTIEFVGFDLILGTYAGWDGDPLGGRLWGIYIIPLDKFIALWIV